MTVKEEKYGIEQKIELIVQYLGSRKSIPDYCSQYGIEEKDFRKWKNQFLKGARDYLEHGGINNRTYKRRIRYLEDKVERLELDNIVLKATIRYLKDS